MNRIYQGRVSKVETVDSKGTVLGELQLEALWEHHELFQTAVNYYTLCLAAMARGLDEAFEQRVVAAARDSAASDPKHKTEQARANAVIEAGEGARAKIDAARKWREAVMNSWVTGERRGKPVEGGYKEIAPILGFSVQRNTNSQDAFAACAEVALAGSRADAEQQASALLQLLEEADKSDLNQLAVGRLPFFCTAKGELGAVSRAEASRQEMARQRIALEFAALSNDAAIERSATLDLGVFLTTPPTETSTGEEAVRTLRKYWEKAKKRYPEINGAAALLEKIAPKAVATNRSVESLCIPALGRKPSGIYPVAAVFRYVPCKETFAAFRAATASLCKAKEKELVEDSIADSRVEGAPQFAYFTNLAFHRVPGATQRAAWFEFDLAAFVEAVKSPHRYYQDTQKRAAAAAVVRDDLRTRENEGRAGSADEGTAARTTLEGFHDDARIEGLIAVLFSDLGHLGEVDTPDDDWLERPFITETIARLRLRLPDNAREYTLRERTLRSWHAIRDAWRDLAENGTPTKDALWDVVAKEQSEHRLDFGSSRFYEALTEPENHRIWQEKGTREYHPDDPVVAWAEYTELRRELRDKERPIRFTPAHPTESPRYFIFPKKAAAGGKWGSTHKRTPAADQRPNVQRPGTLAFTAGIALRDGAKWKPVMARISYLAPRLRRDAMRRDGEENLDAAPWLPPMIAALGLKEPPAQDFGNCRVTLQPRAFEDNAGVKHYNVQLTFPVEIEPENLIAHVGKAKRWAKRFNLTPDGEKFRESTWRKKHEKQPKDPPQPLEELIQSFTFGSVDFGLHADSWALHEVRLDGEFGANKRGPIISRAITTGDEPPWRLATRDLRKLRLPGNDAVVWRKREKNEQDDKAEFDWREELYGDRGRMASAARGETAECRRLMCALLGDRAAWEFVTHGHAEPPEEWSAKMDEMLDEFSFPEQNDKLIVVARRAQSRLARIARWHAGITEESRRESTLKELRMACGFDNKDGNLLEPKQDDQLTGERWISTAIKDAARTNDIQALKTATRTEHTRMINALSPLLVNVANRVLPLRGRSWEWARVKDREKEGRLHDLKQTGPKIDVLLAGQRGLSLMRIEQIEELRRRFQSLNQAERRHFAAEQVNNGDWLPDAAKKWIRRDFSDPCPELLDKLDELKTQRVNQSAHLILAQALGVQLTKPPSNKAELWRERDQHGVYKKFREPVDFIAIEDLSRYRASQGRAPQENGRLMKWCHRAVRDKLRELCEPFGIPVLEVPAAYSSQFCARSGVIGFRAEEVTAGFEKRMPWLFRLRVKEGEEQTTEQREMKQLAADLHAAQAELEREWKTKHRSGAAPKVTLLFPKQGGQIFIPIAATPAQGNRLAAKVGDADLNAAVNIGLRAVADPRMWEFFPRLRTERISGEVRYKGRKGKKTKDANPQSETPIALRAREKRKYGEKGPELSLVELPSGSAARETRQPNYFRDFADVAGLLRRVSESGDAEGQKHLNFARQFARQDTTRVPSPIASSEEVDLLSSKAIFIALKRLQWSRCAEINHQRLKARRRKSDDEDTLP